jgi:hypothetical protein
VRWIVTIEGSSRDIERLIAACPRLRVGAEGREAILALEDGYEDVSDETREAIRKESRPFSGTSTAAASCGGADPLRGSASRAA